MQYVGCFFFLQSNAIITTSQQATLPVQNFWNEFMMAKNNKDRQNLQHFNLESNLRTVATDKKKKK